ncbi:MAG: hypothetical protein MUF81_19425 [Verrucomicrobia bacterium]|jgi:hypothetical protein|nr:hypothetical protein [Verrucomicrobiota bacterium]
MKTTRFNLVVLTVVSLCGIALAAGADEIATNRLSFSARLGFNLSARFKNNIPVPSVGTPTTPRPTSDGIGYDKYDDGYVHTDISDNYGGQTWNWGYDNSANQISGNTILMSRTTPLAASGGSSRTLDDDPILGGELTYNRLLGVKGDARYGIEAAVNYLNVALRANFPVSVSAVRMTDAYPFTPGTTPPDTATGPYQGSFEGPGFVIFTNIASSTTNVISNVSGTDRQRFEANLWGLRLGPYLEVPSGDPMTLSISAGLAVGLLDADASWATTVGSTTHSGGGHDWDVLWGGYVSAAVTWYLSEHWSLIGGAQFQTLGDYEHSFGGRAVEMDLSNCWFVTLGLSCKF